MDQHQKNKSVEQITHNNQILAIITHPTIFNQLQQNNEKMAFPTPNEFPFQVGMHHRQKDEIIKAHTHLPFPELKDFPVQEFFYIVKGKVKIELYDERENDKKITEVIVETGDTITLNAGHRFTFLEESQLIELKQGPYRGRDQEKRFLE